MKPNTFIVSTPSGGYHYYYNYASANKDDEVLNKSFLKNASNSRGIGTDVRSVGGYIVAPPSRRDGKSYKVIDDTAPVDIPSSLISWLIVGKPPDVKERRGKLDVVRELTINNYEYDLTNDQIKTIIAKRPAMYLDNYSDWLIVTTVLKYHGKHQIWDQWSSGLLGECPLVRNQQGKDKQSPRYNQQKNEELCNCNRVSSISITSFGL